MIKPKLNWNFWLDKKTFLIINFNNQELIHRIHCFRYVFYLQNKTKKSCWFVDDLYVEFFSSSDPNICYSTEHLCIHHDYCCNSIFITPFSFLCSLLYSNKNEYIFGFNPVSFLITTPMFHLSFLPTTNLFESL